jgi:hypothetical protein
MIKVNLGNIWWSVVRFVTCLFTAREKDSITHCTTGLLDLSKRLILVVWRMEISFASARNQILVPQSSSPFLVPVSA